MPISTISKKQQQNQTKAVSYKTSQGVIIIGQCKIGGSIYLETEEIYPYAGSLNSSSQ